MTTNMLRCVVCGRLKPRGARWGTFVEAMNGRARPVCGAACLKRQQGERHEQPKGRPQ